MTYILTLSGKKHTSIASIRLTADINSNACIYNGGKILLFYCNSVYNINSKLYDNNKILLKEEKICYRS